MRVKLFITVLLLFVALPWLIAHYTTTARYKPTSQQVDIVSNGYVLRDVLPPDVTNYVLAKINRYNNSLDKRASVYTIADNLITRGTGSYSFQLKSNMSTSTIPVDVRVINYGGLLSITVTIDGVVQDIS